MGGRVVHFEIPYDDGDRARSFYKEAFGWQVQHVPEMDYTMVTTGPTGEQGAAEPGFINGGLMARADSLAGSPVVVVDVESIDVALERIGERLAPQLVDAAVSHPDDGTNFQFISQHDELMTS